MARATMVVGASTCVAKKPMTPAPPDIPPPMTHRLFVCRVPVGESELSRMSCESCSDAVVASSLTFAVMVEHLIH